MEKMIVDKNISYLIGLFQTDGSLYETTRNRGKFQIELNFKDSDIIYKISDLIKYNYKITTRERITNFGAIKSIILTVHNIEFRHLLNYWGIPAGKKSETIAPPLHLQDLSIIDYVRGLYDGDGSIGLTKKNIPFISLTTKSEDIKNFIIKFISDTTETCTKTITKNKRDGIYNITILNENARLLSNLLYYEKCLCINRKFEKVEQIKEWTRPIGTKKVENKKFWNKEQDDFILSNSIDNSMKELDRTKQSIEMRLWRLSNLSTKYFIRSISKP